MLHVPRAEATVAQHDFGPRPRIAKGGWGQVVRVPVETWRRLVGSVVGQRVAWRVVAPMPGSTRDKLVRVLARLMRAS